MATNNNQSHGQARAAFVDFLNKQKTEKKVAQSEAALGLAGVSDWSNWATDTFKSAGADVPNTSPKPLVMPEQRPISTTTQGGFFSQSNLFTDAETMGNQLDLIEKRTQNKKDRYTAAEFRALQLEKSLKTQAARLTQLQSTLQSTPSELGQKLYESENTKYQSALEKYNKAVGAAQTAYDEYKPYADILNSSTGVYNNYLTEQQKLNIQRIRSARNPQDFEDEVKKVQDEIDELEYQRRPYQANLDYFKSMEFRNGTDNPDPEYTKKKDEAQQLLDSFDQQIKAAKTQLAVLEEEQDTYETYKYEKTTEADDFVQYSKPSNEYDGMDLQYQYFAPQSHPEDAGTWNGHAIDLDYLYVNDINDARTILNNLVQSDNYKRYDHMTKEEICIYNYLYNKEGKVSADEYLKYLTDHEETVAGENGEVYRLPDGLNYRRGVELAKNYNALERHITAPIASGLDQFAHGVQQLFTKDVVPTSSTQYAAQEVRKDMGAVSGFMFDLLQTGANMAPSILLSAMTGGSGGVVGAASMGLSAAGNAYAEKVKEGYDPVQARIYSSFVGASEGGLQYLLGGISKLGAGAKAVNAGKIASKINAIDKSFLRISAKLAYGGAKEGFEESLQAVLEPLYSSLVFDESYDAPEFGDVAYDFLLGFFSAGMLEGVSTTSNDIKATKSGKTLYKISPNIVESLIEAGTQPGADVASQEIASELSALRDSGQDISAYLLGEIYARHAQGAISAQQTIDREWIDRLSQAQSRLDADLSLPQTETTSAGSVMLPTAERASSGVGIMLPTAEQTAPNNGATYATTNTQAVQGETETTQEIFSGFTGALSGTTYTSEQSAALASIPESGLISALDSDAGTIDQNVLKLSDNPAAWQSLVDADLVNENDYIQGAVVVDEYLRRRSAAADSSVLPTAQDAHTDTTLPATQDTVPADGTMLPTADQPSSNGIVLPTAAEAELRRRMRNAETDLERTAIQYGVDSKTVEQVKRVAAFFGRDAVFFNEEPDMFGNLRLGKSNKDDGRIYINVAGLSAGVGPLVQTISHEMTHLIENSWGYKKLEKLVEKRLKQTGESLDALTKQKAAAYAAAGVKLFTYEAKREVIAEYVSGHILTDEATIRELVDMDAGLGRRILNRLESLWARVSKNTELEERAFIRQAMSFYSKALDELRPEHDALSHTHKLAKEAIAAREALNEQFANGEITEDDYNAAMAVIEGEASANGVSLLEDAGGGEQYSIININGQKRDYGKGVLLDTDFFDEVKPRKWGDELGRFVYNMTDHQLTMYDEEGNAETVYLARENDRVRKDGIKNAHRVIDKLAGYRGNAIRAKAIVHMSEALATSGQTEYSNEHSHQWMDENGWIKRKTYLQDLNGNIYEAILNIANGRDRKILYEISHVHQIDKKRTNASIPPTDNGQHSRYQEPRVGRTQSKVHDDRVTQSTPEVNNDFSEAETESLHRLQLPSVYADDTDTDKGWQNSIVNIGGTEATDYVPGSGDVRKLQLPGGEENFGDRSTTPSRAQSYLRKAERSLLEQIGNIFSVPRFAQRTHLQSVVQSLSNEYLQTGTVSQETIDDLFKRAYANGVVIDSEFYEQYKHIKDYLRSQSVTISPEDRSSIADWNSFRKYASGTLRIVNGGGLPVDTIYSELQNMASELFPASITHPADQLQRMYEVGRSIERVEKSLEDAYGDNAAEFEAWARNDFNAAVADAMNHLRDVKRYTDERASMTKQESTPITTMNELMSAWQNLKEARREVDKVAAKNLLTEHDQVQLGRLLKGEIMLEHLDPEKDNVRGITAMYGVKQEYERWAKILGNYNRARKASLRAKADTFMRDVYSWKEPKHAGGFIYSHETMERNIRNIVPDDELAQSIIDEYFTPVHKNEAASTKMKNSYRDKVKALNLSRKVDKDNLVSEAHAVQLLGEAEDNIKVILDSKGHIKTRDNMTLAEWQSVVQKLWLENPTLDRDKITAAVKEFRNIYDDLYNQMNAVRVRNGYEPVNYRKGYFPHFQPGATDSVLSTFGKILGIDTNVSVLPTTINGLTHTFKPGITYFGNAQARLGFNTAYDAVEGFDKYIEGVSDVINHTDDIQRLRALASQIRYRASNEGLREQVDAVMANSDIAEQDKQNRIDQIYADGPYSLKTFVVELDEYTNLLANKKSLSDRVMEQAVGRKMYTIVKQLESNVAANMVALNVGSWLTNFIPLAQGFATLDRFTILGGMWDTLKAYKTDDGIVGRSSFLTNRRGSDPIVKTWSQRASDYLSKPMTFIDCFTADSLVRARYKQNLKRGISEDAAMSEADAWTAGVMADRSKGATPTLFNRKNPVTKLFTQFQLEVNNQLGYLFKDLPRDTREKGKAALVAALLKLFIGSFLYNEVYEYFVGRRPALDPIGILNDTVGYFTGYELPNLVELGVGALTGNIPSFETDKKKTDEALGAFSKDVLEQVPFVGNLVGGGRLPIGSALPDLGNLSQALINGDWDTKKRVDTALNEIGKPLTYVVPPFGGGQAKKIYQGVKAIKDGGSYTKDSDGNDILQYPVYTDSAGDKAKSLIQSMLFGKTALKTGREWVDSGFDSFGASQTATYQALLDAGVPDREAFALMESLNDAKKTDTESEATQKRNLLIESTLTDEQKIIAYRGTISNEHDEKIEAFRKAGINFDQFLRAQNEYAAINETDQKASQKATAFSRWVNSQNLTKEQADVVRDTLIPQKASWYDNLYAAGLDDDSAYKITTAIENLQPEDGKNTVGAEQRWLAVVESTSDIDQQLAALSTVMDEDAYAKLQIGHELGVEPSAYVRIKEALPRYNEDGKGGPKNDEVKKAIDEMSTLGIVLPGGDGSIFTLTNSQRAVLWQLLTGNTSARNNPYSRSDGQKVIDAKAKAKAETDGRLELPR